MERWVEDAGVKIARAAIAWSARLITAVRANWQGIEPVDLQRVYFANHTSNGDTILIWTVLPQHMRNKTRPVAAAEYWRSSPVRRFLGETTLNAVLIDRIPEERTVDPVAQMTEALDEGSSLILFPEGTRNTGDETLLPFKTGLFHLAEARPNVDLVPVWIENLSSVLPKGEVLPVPLLCTVTFGSPLKLHEAEDRDAFLARARRALLDLGEAE